MFGTVVMLILFGTCYHLASSGAPSASSDRNTATLQSQLATTMQRLASCERGADDQARTTESALDEQTALVESLNATLKNRTKKAVEEAPTPPAEVRLRPKSDQPWDYASRIENRDIGGWDSQTGVFVFGSSVDRFWVALACMLFHSRKVDAAYLCEGWGGDQSKCRAEIHMRTFAHEGCDHAEMFQQFGIQVDGPFHAPATRPGDPHRIPGFSTTPLERFCEMASVYQHKRGRPPAVVVIGSTLWDVMALRDHPDDLLVLKSFDEPNWKNIREYRSKWRRGAIALVKAVHRMWPSARIAYRTTPDIRLDSPLDSYLRTGERLVNMFVLELARDLPYLESLDFDRLLRFLPARVTQRDSLHPTDDYNMLFVVAVSDWINEMPVKADQAELVLV